MTDSLRTMYPFRLLRPAETRPISHLFSPDPIVSPSVESLTSYIARLASCHDLTVTTLFYEEIRPRLRSIFEASGKAFPEHKSKTLAIRYYGEYLNGKSVGTANFTEALVALTNRRSLTQLSMLFWARTVGEQQLTRRQHAWCPSCYREQVEHDRPVYDQLLWSIECVTVCTKHHCELQHQCPFPDCARSFTRLTSQYSPGYCSYCRRWMGWSEDDGEHPDWLTQHRREAFNATAIGEMIRTAAFESEIPSSDKMILGVRACVDTFAGGNIRKFAELVSVGRSALARLLDGTSLLTLTYLLNICFRHGLSLTSLLLRGELDVLGLSGTSEMIAASEKRVQVRELVQSETEVLQPQSGACSTGGTEYVPQQSVEHSLVKLTTAIGDIQHYSSERSSLTTTSLDHERIKLFLTDILAQQTPRPLVEVAGLINKSKHYLYKNFPDLSKQISRRYLAHRALQAAQRETETRSWIRKIVLDLHAQDIYPSRKQIKKVVGRDFVFNDVIKSEWKKTLRELKYITADDE